jgi:4-hydroxy-4-methyl-2-oxoglutarate aldolase
VVPEKADEGLIRFLRTVDSPTVSNAIELSRVRPRNEGFAPLQLRCLFPELGPMCGYAVTAHVETVTRSSEKAEGTFIELFQAVADSPKPAVVVFQEVGGQPDSAAHCGEVMATIFSRVGGIGVVSDCGVRDLAEVRAIKFHYFARGAVASHANFRVVRVGVAVQILGVVIQPGSLLHGDRNGLITVPPEAFSGLPQAVEAIRSRERKLMDFVRGAGFKVSDLKGRFLE